jgi:hypothetical protein
MYNVLNSEPLQAGGWATVGLSLSTAMIEWVSSVTINDVLQGILAILGATFLLYRLLTQRVILRNELLDEKLKKKALEEED